MVKTNRTRVRAALDVLAPELAKYVEQELRDVYAENWIQHLGDGHVLSDGTPKMDNQRCLNTILKEWDLVFEVVLDKSVRNTAFAVKDWRNKDAHDEQFTNDEAMNALIDIQKLLEGIESAQVDEVEREKLDLMKHLSGAATKTAGGKPAAVPLSGLEVGGLKAWREVVVPHSDVREGTLQQAEFAADLWQVYTGKASDEYQKPIDFFNRTYLTEGLKELLSNSIKRMTGAGGDPVVELQINFGGGKTHSMLALYHLFGGQARALDLQGVSEILAGMGIADVPTVARAVVVGTVMRPGSPQTKADGTVVKTLWGEIAWQLGGREGYEIVREADETATNPGDLMDELFAHTGPALILIDEWVAYARQLFERQNMLPAGTFDTQFTFAQTLCEAARRAKNVLVCVSIPASISADGNFYSSGQAGDSAGQSALSRLKDAVGRSNMVWRPASTDESFEIVRRRLFEPLSEEAENTRDVVIKEFTSFYNSGSNKSEFPEACQKSDYGKRMKSAYPIHPELFDRLYEDWSSLEKFQRTRGVLRFMASVIHTLWMNQDPGSLILPSSVPLADRNVVTEICRYLSEQWSGVIDRDVDGLSSVPRALDAENPNYNKVSACRRVARTVFLGSAPSRSAATKGIDEKRIKLGCAHPKETIAIYGEALNKLRQKTMYLYVDGARAWYDTQASVNREALDRAERFAAEEVNDHIKERLRALVGRNRGEFSGVHVGVQSADIPDDLQLRLVVLGAECAHKQAKNDSPALVAARDVLKSHGSAPRNHRNRLIFLAPDEVRLAELQREVRLCLAWASIVKDINAEILEVDKANRQQASSSASTSDRAVATKLGEVYQWVLAPFQNNPTDEVEWEKAKLSARPEAMANAIIKKLEPAHITRELGGTMLRRDLDRVPLWGDGRLSISQLEEFYARYTYLPRLIDVTKISAAVREAVNSVGGIAFADSYDPETETYSRLRFHVHQESNARLQGILVEPSIASPIIEAEDAAAANIDPVPPRSSPTVTPTSFDSFWGNAPSRPVAPSQNSQFTRFHGTIDVSSDLLTSRASEIAREIVQNLSKTAGSKIRISIDISAENPQGFTQKVIQDVNENCRTLRFSGFEFEED